MLMMMQACFIAVLIGFTVGMIGRRALLVTATGLALLAGYGLVTRNELDLIDGTIAVSLLQVCLHGGHLTGQFMRVRRDANSRIKLRS